jgi:hypothetical protein
MLKIVLSISCVMFSAATFAGTSDIKASNNQINIEAISTNVDYTETGDGRLGTQTGTVDTETGHVHGHAISISTMWGAGNEYFEGKYDHSSGNTTYTGALQGGVFGSVVGTSSAVLDNYSVRFGKGFIIDNVNDQFEQTSEVTDLFMLTPYIELGHHKWDRGVNYGEIYKNNWFGIGGLGQYSPVRNFVLSANAMVGETFGSYITVNSGGGLNGFSGSLGNSTRYNFGVSADYAFMKHFHGNLSIDYTSFSYGISGIFPVGGGYVGWEPNSKTNYTTTKVGLGYAF